MTNKEIEFREFLVDYEDPRMGKRKSNVNMTANNSSIWNNDSWNERLTRLSSEGYNALVWIGPNEFGAYCTGSHVLLRHERFPEAREIGEEENEK